MQGDRTEGAEPWRAAGPEAGTGAREWLGELQSEGVGGVQGRPRAFPRVVCASCPRSARGVGWNGRFRVSKQY